VLLKQLLKPDLLLIADLICDEKEAKLEAVALAKKR